MIKISKGPGGEALHLMALVAFDRTSGQVYGTFVHASLQEDDDVGVSRSRELFLADLASHPGRERAQIEALQVSLPDCLRARSTGSTPEPASSRPVRPLDNCRASRGCELAH